MNGFLEFMLSPDPIASVLAAISGALAALFLSKGKSTESKSAREKTKAEEFETAIASDDIKVLGGYLRDRLGRVTLGNYLDDNEARTRVNRYLSRISALVELPEADVATNATPPDTVPPSEEAYEPKPQDPRPIERALAQLREKEIWSALAGLRRDLETKLVARAGISKWRGPPYALIDDPDVRGTAGAFWQIANRAIHGADVSYEEALAAINRARQVYQYLGSPQI